MFWLNERSYSIGVFVWVGSEYRGQNKVFLALVGKIGTFSMYLQNWTNIPIILGTLVFTCLKFYLKHEKSR